MAIVIHFIAAPFEQSFSYEGDFDKFSEVIHSIRNLINIDKAGENLYNVTPSGIATQLGAEPEKLYGKLFDLVNHKHDPRIIKLNTEKFSLRTEVENGTFRYFGSINEKDVLGFEVNNRESVEMTISYIETITEISTMLTQFLVSVKQDFPEHQRQPVEEPIKEEVNPAPAFLPVEEVKERVPTPRKLGDLPQSSPVKKEELGILVCTLGGPVLEVVVRSPIAHRLASETFALTLKGYLDQNGVLSVADNSRRLLAVSKDQSSRFEDIIRSALHDHNALDGVEIDREEYVPGKSITGRVYL